MTPENKLSYIIPQIVKYQNVDDLLENNSHHSLFNENNLSINDVLKENFVCIVGEPGIGKSRLLDEVKERILPKPFFYKASEFTTLSTPKENEYCIIDALDEVEGHSFYNVLQSIKHYKKKNPKIKVLFTCRKHYVASYARHFADCNHLTFIEICRLSERDVMNVISGNCNCSEATLANINKSPKLKELITIPRYLTFLLEYIKQKGECLNIGELFEYMIVCSIKAAIEAHKGIQNTESIRILLQRLLEKMAFVMEISRKDQISKDELYTILDGIKGNMTQMFIANFDLLYFESRILKDTDGTLQFENTELQEYLAAKELCRQDDIESVLYDVAVHKELKHIYPNWYDVIPHISYSKDRIHTFINVFRLIISYESNLENVAFENLLKYVDPSVLSIQQKEELFSIIFEHYQRIPAYIMWKSSMSNLLQKCYTINCDSQIILSHDKLNKIQLSNVTVTLDAIVEVKKHSDGIYNYWRQAANYLMGTDDNENKLAALNLYNALKCVDELIQLSESYSYFTKKLKEKYCEVTGYMRIADNRVVDCWLNDCYEHTDLDHSIAAAKALDIISNGDYGWNIGRYRKLFSLLEDESITSVKMQCNEIMIEKFQDSEAITWRINYLKNNVIRSSHNETGEFRPISQEEAEIISTKPYMFRCFMRIKENEALAEQMLNLFDFGLKLCVNSKTQQYAYYLLNQIYHFFVDLNKIHYISMLREKVEKLNKKNVSYLATNIMNNAEMLFLKNEKTNIGKAVKRYNKCIEDSHLSIRNDGDLRRYFTQIYCEVQKEIQDQGIYALVRQDLLNEDFIQRELKNTIINKCCQMGLEAVKVDREVALQDNKRTDILIRYGMCNPIMIELKLLHNNEIQQNSKRHKYKEKFIQYINATNPCLSVFWVFDVHKGGNYSKFDELKEEYKDLHYTLVLLTDCKCSSIETGIGKNNS